MSPEHTSTSKTISQAIANRPGHAGISQPSTHLPPISPLQPAPTTRPVQRVEIVGTTHNDYLPGQDSVHPDIVDLLADGLKTGRFERSSSFKTNVEPNEKGSAASDSESEAPPKILDDGHHSYVASKRADVDIEIEDMGVNKYLDAYDDDWSKVRYKRFLDFENYLKKNGFVHHERLATLIEAAQNGDNLQNAVDELKPFEADLILNDPQYSDVLVEASDENELREALSNAQSGEGSDIDEENEDKSNSSGGSLYESSGSSEEGIEDDMETEPTPTKPNINEAFKSFLEDKNGQLIHHSGYFWLKNYGLGSIVHGHVDQGQCNILDPDHYPPLHPYAAVLFSSGKIIPKYQSWRPDQPGPQDITNTVVYIKITNWQ